ncbi:MAG: alpha/beta hydrolase [Bacteroidota bacterium]
MKNTLHILENISVEANIPFKTVDGTTLELDVYYPAEKLGEEPWDKLSDIKKPTLIYFHGGGWIEGDRTSRFLHLLPYLEKDWCVVNVDYRLLDQTHVLGCLNDCIDAINWVKENAGKYKFNLDKVYLSGESAGGHLALLAGMRDSFEDADNFVHIKEVPIAGIINWYGITHMQSAIDFWNDASYTQMILDHWTGDNQVYLDMASPINHIDAATPPILTIHGDADINVEFEQAHSFHKALEAKKVKNELIRIPGKKHGNFSAEELEMAFERIWKFYNSID